MTEDLSEFVALSKRNQRTPCSVGAALAQLQPRERKLLEKALAQTSDVIRNAGIQAWLQARGIEVASAAITTHRRKKCRCHPI